MNTLSKTVAVILLLVPPGAQAQQREFYDARTGAVAGRSITDSAGATTVYSADGKVVGRSTTDSGGTVTTYDAAGRVVGTATKPGKDRWPARR